MGKSLYTAIVVDDEQDARDMLQELLEDFPEIQLVSKDASVNEAITSLLAYQPNIVFLDIDMPEKDGFELAQFIREKRIEAFIIFTTAYQEHAIKGYKYSALDYLLKPINRQEIKNTIRRFKTLKGKSSIQESLDYLTDALVPEKFRINTRTGFALIDPKQLVYCKADGNYSRLYLKCGDSKVISQQLGKLEEQLKNKMFIRINRSTLINKSFISTFDRSTKKIQLVRSSEELTLKVTTKFVKNIL